MPKVWNKKDPNCPKGQTSSYVGRPSKYGNPYHIGFGGATRDEVIRSYANWIKHKIERGEMTIEEIKKDLKGKDLVCYCAPEPCHADILLLLANEDDAKI